MRDLCMVILLLSTVVASAGAVNVARLPGVLPVVDSSQRDRWGTEGYLATSLCDGNLPGRAFDAWSSDNWEVTHTAALVFPARMRVTGLRVVWWNKLAPRRATVEGLRDGGWKPLARIECAADVDASELSFDAADIDAIRIVQRPDGAHPKADRRLQIGEVEVLGDATGVSVDAPSVAARLRAELRDLRRQEDAARVKPQIDLVMQRIKPRGFMGIVNAKDRERGRRNAATRPWARTYRDSVVRDADWWVAQTDEYIRGLLPEGNPRALCPSFEKGCPIHGGARSSFETTMETPYRWRCRQGGEWWYDGVVTKNPATGAEVTVRDDGSGWLAPAGFPNAGRRYYFVAAYRYYRIGKLFSGPYEPDSGESKYKGGTPVMQLAWAYAFTGDARYAHKAAVMLSRLADLYPGYDGCVEGPSERQDGYIGQTFERFLTQNLILACDLVWDELDASQREHIQRNLLARIYEYLHRLMPYFDGDFLMYEMTSLSSLGTVLDNPDIVAEAMESDTGLRVMLTNSWFRDGKFVYDSCGYNVGNNQAVLLIAEYLHGYSHPPRFPKPIDVYNDPQYRVGALYDFIRRIDCDGRVPPIGDGGGGRGRVLQTAPTYSIADERALLRLPSERAFYEKSLLAVSGGDLERFRSGRADWWLVFHAEDPLPVVKTTPRAPVQTSHLFPDSGIAVLRAGSVPETRQHTVLTFSKGAYGHGHRDKLAINLMRYGFEPTADIGYPSTWTDIKCGGWETDTASHCTVMLDGKSQHGNWIGELGYYAEMPGVDVVEAHAERAAYPEASLYRRTVALVRDERGEPLYTFDVFRVAGAKQRDYLFHGMGKPEDMQVAVAGAAAPWVAQARGSLAGEEVGPMTAGSYGFLFGVSRCRSDAGAVATWRSASGYQSTDAFLLTRRRFGDCVVEFTMTRTGQAGGTQDRAFLVFGADLAATGNRRVIALAGDALEIGKPVVVRIEIRGGTAAVTVDGKSVPHEVTAVGTPLERGSIGFLHYYNYGYEYAGFSVTPLGQGEVFRDDFRGPLDSGLWSIGPTYAAAGGRLVACDATRVGMALHLLGAPGREYIRAKAEGPGVRGKSPFEGHLITREVAADPAAGSAFVAVQEVFTDAPRVKRIDRMRVTPAADRTPDGRARLSAVAARVTVGDRVDYLLSALDAKRRTAVLDDFRFSTDACFALISTRGGKVVSMACVGGSVTYGARTVAAPATVRGKVLRTDPVHSLVAVTVASEAMRPRSGAVLVVRSRAYATPGVYRIVSARRIDGLTWRLRVDPPLSLARGIVGDVDAGKRSFASRTPVGKLRFIGGFEGKPVRQALASASPEYRLGAVSERAFALPDAASAGRFPSDGQYVVLDVGAGDAVEVLYGAQWDLYKARR